MSDKRFTCRKLLFTAMILISFLMIVPVSAATTSKKYTVKAGTKIKIMDRNISSNRITQNKFTITPKTSATRYDIVYAENNDYGDVVVKSLIYYGKTFKSKAVKGYIKSSAASNIGTLFSIYVRKGSVEIKVSSTRSKNTYALKNVKTTQAPLTRINVKKGDQIRFRMTSGNTSYLPVIICGTRGGKIKLFSADSPLYYLSTFEASRMRTAVKFNGESYEGAPAKYDSKFTQGGKTYNALYSIAGNDSGWSRWYKTINGNVCYWYPKADLGIFC